MNLENAARSLYLQVTRSPSDGRAINSLVTDVEQYFIACLSANVFAVFWDNTSACNGRVLRIQHQSIRADEPQGCLIQNDDSADITKYDSDRRSSARCRQAPARVSRPESAYTRCPLPLVVAGSSRATARGASASPSVCSAWADIIYGERMAWTFEHVRRRLGRLRDSNDGRDLPQVRRHATAMQSMAAQGGLRRLAGRVAPIREAWGYVTRDALDGVQRELDAGEALWRAVGRAV